MYALASLKGSTLSFYPMACDQPFLLSYPMSLYPHSPILSFLAARSFTVLLPIVAFSSQPSPFFAALFIQQRFPLFLSSSFLSYPLAHFAHPHGHLLFLCGSP